MRKDVGMLMHISSGVFEAVLADARLTPGMERCGLLLGQGEMITAFIPAINVAVDLTQEFEVDPTVLLTAYRYMREGGPMLLGHYHFHPHGDVSPSMRDADASHGDGAYWLIIGADNHALWRAVPDGSIHAAFEPAELALATD
jgi:desampylase